MARVFGFNYQPYGSIPSGIENATLSDSLTYEGVKGFIADLSGTLAVEMEDGSSGTMAVIGGSQYAGSVVKFKSTGSSTVTAVTIFY